MTAEDFTNLHLQYLSTQAEGELPATIEQPVQPDHSALQRG